MRKILWSKVGCFADRKLVKRLWFRLLCKIPEKTIWRYYNKMVVNANKKKTRMVRILMFPTANSEYGYYRNWYENNVDTVFEGKTLIMTVTYILNLESI